MERLLVQTIQVFPGAHDLDTATDGNGEISQIAGHKHGAGKLRQSQDDCQDDKTNIDKFTLFSQPTPVVICISVAKWNTH
ncbi:MAG: hypothetical protein ABSH53_01135 [Holophaga sp.]